MPDYILHHGLDWMKPFTIGREVIKKLEDLNLVEELNKVTFNPLVENDCYYWDRSYIFNNEDDIVAVEINNLCHCETSHEFGEVFLLDWFCEAIVGNRFDDTRFHTPKVLGDVIEHIQSEVDPNKQRTKKVITKFEVECDNHIIPVYIGGYSMGFGGDPTYLIFNKSNLPKLIIKALDTYHLHTYINDRISEMIVCQVKGTGFHESMSNSVSLESILLDLMNSLEIDIDDYVEWRNN